ncbi:uncharacterized protein LOC113146677 [Cyclospora cayetanensis]|uniref:Uncharacterized protein LOC113146677 n=1 Tax=Cyclospora cayetanensis TaxID=88456 RepID=A0A6P6RTU9_9EIME|nr:uncharacterized protein LOC113146677 [Cyclospora cayetanensis]
MTKNLHVRSPPLPPLPPSPYIHERVRDWRSAGRIDFPDAPLAFISDSAAADSRGNRGLEGPWRQWWFGGGVMDLAFLAMLLLHRTACWGPSLLRGVSAPSGSTALFRSITRRVADCRAYSSSNTCIRKAIVADNDSSSHTARSRTGKEVSQHTPIEAAPPTDLSCSSSRVYKQPEGHIDVVFKWGIGNAFRAQNANRFRPVHAARPRKVSLPASYFDSPCFAVSFEALNEAWEVTFFENNKRSSKPFPIKKWGVFAAKKEAVAFADAMKSHRASVAAPGNAYSSLPKQLVCQTDFPYSPVSIDSLPCSSPSMRLVGRRVVWDGVTSTWVSLLQLDGRPSSRSFSAELHGFLKAKQLAEQAALTDAQPAWAALGGTSVGNLAAVTGLLPFPSSAPHSPQQEGREAAMARLAAAPQHPEKVTTKRTYH